MTRETSVSIEDLERIEEKKAAKPVKGHTGQTKTLVIRQNDVCHNYVAWEGSKGGAPIPAKLQGVWISKLKLQNAIKQYMDQRG
jgi:hypothetical protein